MEEYHQITLDEWTAWREDIRKKLSETAQNFVYIGFRLKQIRDSGMFGGAADIFEFAQQEYGLGKSTVSRFIAINEKYSKNGNSLELKDEYIGYSSSKLSEMLTLNDADIALISEKTTVKEIREFKTFTKTEAEGQTEANPLLNCLIDYFKDKKEMLNKAIQLIHDNKLKEAAEEINPSGSGIHNKGVCFMFMYEYDRGVKYRLITNPIPQSMRWDEVLDLIALEYGYLYREETGGDVWSAYYDQNKPIEEVQTVENTEFEAIVSEKKEDSEPIEDTEEVKEEKTLTETVKTTPIEGDKSEEKAQPAAVLDKTVIDEDKNEKTPENTEFEPVATSQQREDFEEKKTEVVNELALKRAKSALDKINQSFKEGDYKKAIDMADVFIIHIKRAIS